MSSEKDPILSSSHIGIQMDADPLTMQDGEYSYALNCGIVNRQGFEPFIGNMESNIFTAALPLGYMVVGNRKLDRNDVVLMIVNTVGDSEIGIFNKGVYTKVVHDNNLKFNIRKPITVKFKTNYKGERIIYWTDNDQPPRWMNLDKPNFLKVLGPDNCTLVDSNELDLDFMKIFKDYYPPCMKIDVITEDGNLKSGGYFITSQYADAAGNGLTECFPLIGDIPIFESSTSQTSNDIVGIESGKTTSKSIKLSLSNMDISFTHLNIIAVKVINGVVEAFKVGTISTSSTQFVYNGAGNREIPMLLDDVIAAGTKYRTAKTIEVTNTQLLLGNLRGVKSFNFQPYIQKVQVQWQNFKADSNDVVNSYKNPKFAAYMRCFRRDEVYALGLIIDLIDGSYTDVWHVPGRRLNKKSDGTSFNQTVDQFGNTIDPNHWDDSDQYTGADNYENADKRYKLYNTATVEGTQSTGAPTGLAEYGEMSYHESSERYECNKDVYGEDAGEPIRHHHFPDSTILHIHDGLDGVRKKEESVTINYLGIRLPNIDDVLASLPPDIKKLVKGYRIVVADRTYDKSVLASGIMLNSRYQDWSELRDGSDVRLYPNYPLNDLRPDPYIDMPNTNTAPADQNAPLSTQFYKDSFFFHSPDTHFKKQQIVPNQLKVNVELYGDAASKYDFMEPYPEFNEKGKDNDRAALQGYSRAWYNNYKVVKQNNTRRKLAEAFYVPFSGKVGAGTAGKSIWNVLRESSVFLHTTSEIDNPTVTDTSRFVMNDRDQPDFDQRFNCTIWERKRNASIYYGSIKNPVPNQYGTLFDLKYIDTFPCKPDFLPDNVFFGGDTYIGNFTMKIQNVFYQDTQSLAEYLNGMPGVNLSGSQTIPYTHFFYKNQGQGNSARQQSRMMCEDNDGHGVLGVGGDGDATALGYITMALFGVPSFWAESDYNIALRHAGITSDETFYPNFTGGVFQLKEWLAVTNLNKDNVFKYNTDFSFKNNFKVNSGLSPFYDPATDQASHYNTRTIYSLKSQPEDIQDNWLKFKPLDYYDLPKNKGELIDIRYIGNYKTLFRMKDTIFMDSLYGEMETSLGKVQLGSGKLFEREPKEIISTDDGYGGTLSQFAFNNTEFGPLFPSVNSRKCFAIGENIMDIGTGAKNWLDINLPFKLAAQIPVLSVDNACNPEGIGLLSCWDKTAGLWFITKRDYEVRDPKNIKLLHYKDEQLYLGDRQVSLQDPKLFINRSWTFAFSPERKRWISWQSFIPSFYIVDDNDMYTGINGPDTSIWKHNIEGDYTTFYGKKYPWIIEGCGKADGVNPSCNPTITIMSQAMSGVGKNEQVTFNKAIVYNMFMCSGLRNLIIQDENDLSKLFSELKVYPNSIDVALRIREGHFNFSDFHDIYKHESSADFFTDNWDNDDFREAYPIDKVLNNQVLNYDAREDDYSLIREKWLKYRLILDNRHNVKLLLQMTVIGNRQTIS